MRSMKAGAAAGELAEDGNAITDFVVDDGEEVAEVGGAEFAGSALCVKAGAGARSVVVAASPERRWV